MKILHWVIFILAFTVMNSAAWSHAGVQSQSYTIKVFLPAIAGVNVPDSNQESGVIETFTNHEDNLQILSENVIREGQEVLLKTIIAR